jgi:hypothetical protein
MCVANQVQDFDRLALPFNRSVTFSYQSEGETTKVTTRKVNGAFPTSVKLRLVIVNETSGEPETEYDKAVDVDCKLKARLLKAGDRDKVKLLCDLGANLSKFPDLTSALIQNVANAYGPGKRARVKTKKGTLKISHAGDPADAAGVPISCSLLDD